MDDDEQSRRTHSGLRSVLQARGGAQGAHGDSQKLRRELRDGGRTELRGTQEHGERGNTENVGTRGMWEHGEAGIRRNVE